jgi:hypothetical protein
MDMTEAIAAKMRYQSARPQRAGFEPDEELERMGRRLDLLRETDPPQADSPALAGVRGRVALYRRRKAEHEEGQSA